MATRGKHVVEASGLCRVFRTAGREIRAVDGITLSVAEGEIFGLLGPNGAGKTTLIKMISTLVLPTAGKLTVCGFDVVSEDRSVRRSIGVVLANKRSLYWKLTVNENMEFFGALYGLTRAQVRARGAECLELVGLTDRQRDRVEVLSTGMQQRLQIAIALLHKPKLLVLDEPTSGLDPVTAEDLRNSLRSLNLQGLSILMSTHNLDEAERFCDRVAILHKGRIRGEGPPLELRNGFGRYVVEFVIAGPGVERAIAYFQGRERLFMERLTETALSVSFATTDSPDEVLVEVQRDLLDMGLRITRFDRRSPSLGDVFRHLTNEKFV